MLAISVDSGCAPTRDFINKYKINLLGMKLIIDEKEYTDSFEFLENGFYNIVETADEFHTAQPPLGQVIEYYNSIRDSGYDELIDIHFSSNMSGIYETSLMASGMVDGLKVHVIDTKKVSIGSFLVANRIVKMVRNEGKDAEYVLKKLPAILENSYMQFSVPTLKYLVKNGRVGHAQGIAGTLLNIKPLLSVNTEGFIYPQAKLRGVKKVIETMADNICTFLENRRSNLTLYGIHGMEEYKDLHEQALGRTIEMLEEKLGLTRDDFEIVEGRIWPTVACHSGPAVFGVACYGEGNDD